MKCYLEFYILREYKRQGKRAEYRILKKKLVEILNSQGWACLAGKLLGEDKEFTEISGMDIQNNSLAAEVELDELVSAQCDNSQRSQKLEYFIEFYASKVKYLLRLKKQKACRKH